MNEPAIQEAGSEPLPELRADLQVVSGGEAGEPVIFDPIRRRYFKIDQTTAQLLSMWPKCSNLGDLVSLMNARFGILISAEQAADLKKFLLSNQLAIAQSPQAWSNLAALERHSSPSWWQWAMHNYLFFKYPLFKPQRSLEWLASKLEFVYTRGFFLGIAIIGLAGIYLVSRQWDAFTGTFLQLLSMEGALAFAIALAIVKSLHELGHAITAVRYGCRVPTIGICFMVLVPMLFTDVSDAWRLNSRRQRLAIDGAGLVVETAIACVATFVWAFLSEGVIRSIAFSLATTSWLLTLVLNLNPFMRFDGYYILADLTGIENFQPRAFALGRWRMREILFGLGVSSPERVAPWTRKWLVIYAWLTWVYRFVLFTGIAILVYHIGFKLLGIVLFLIEIVYFVFNPIRREIKEWYRMRALIIARRRGVWAAAAILVALGVCFVPLSTSVRAPAHAEDRDMAQIYPRRAAYIVESTVRQGDHIEAGAVIANLASPEIGHEAKQTSLRIAQVIWRLERRSGNPIERAETIVLEESLRNLRNKLADLGKEQAELRVVAPISGTIAELAPNLHNGRWLQRSDLIALVRGAVSCSVRGYVSEDDVSRIETATTGLFVPEDLTEPIRRVQIERIAGSGTGAMDLIELSSHYGGGVAARSLSRRGDNRVQVPVAGQFLVFGTFSSDGGDCNRGHASRGTLHLTGRAETLAARSWRNVLKVLVRESGF